MLRLTDIDAPEAIKRCLVAASEREREGLELIGVPVGSWVCEIDRANIINMQQLLHDFLCMCFCYSLLVSWKYSRE